MAKRFTDRENSLLQSTFKDQENLLVLIRKFFLQVELAESEQKYLREVCSSEVVEMFRKIIGLDLNTDVGIGMLNDIYSGVDLKPTEKSHALLQIKSLNKERLYLSQRLDTLQGKKVTNEIKLTDLMVDNGDDETYINFITRNSLLKTIEIQFLLQIQILSGTLNAEELMAKMKKQSAK